MSNKDIKENMVQDIASVGVHVPCEHLVAFQNARMEIQEKGINQTAVNPRFNSPYTSLDDIISICEPILLKNGLLTTFTQTYDKEVVHGNEQSTVHFVMRITHVSTRQYFESSVTMFAKREPQPIGSVMTYAKRYLYQNILMITGSVDDDGNQAQSSVERHKR